MFKKIGLIFKNSLSDSDKNSLKRLIPVLIKSDCTIFVEEEINFDENFATEVLDDFPKITSNILKPAIVRASYEIDINKIKNWKIETLDFYKKVFKNE